MQEIVLRSVITHYDESIHFHGFYTVVRFLPSESRPLDEDLSRHAWPATLRRVLALALNLIGVGATKHVAAFFYVFCEDKSSEKRYLKFFLFTRVL